MNAVKLLSDSCSNITDCIYYWLMTAVKLLNDDCNNINDFIYYWAMIIVKLLTGDCNITNCIYYWAKTTVKLLTAPILSDYCGKNNDQWLQYWRHLLLSDYCCKITDWRLQYYWLHLLLSDYYKITKCMCVLSRMHAKNKICVGWRKKGKVLPYMREMCDAPKKMKK
jgi:hypothetical protein